MPFGSKYDTTGLSAAQKSALKLLDKYKLPPPVLPTSGLIGKWNFCNAALTSPVLNDAYTGARTNLLAAKATAASPPIYNTTSEPVTTELNATDGAVADYSTGIDLGGAIGVRPAIALGVNYGLASRAVTLTAATYTFSIYAKHADGSAITYGYPGLFFSYNGVDMASSGAGYTINAPVAIGGGVYRYSVTVTTCQASNKNWNVTYSNAASGKTLYITGWQIDAGSSATAYEKTPYNDITLVGGPTAGSNGMTFGGSSHYGVTPAWSLLDVTADWTIFAVINLGNGTSGTALSVCSPTSGVTAGQKLLADGATPAKANPVSYAGATTNTTAQTALELTRQSMIVWENSATLNTANCNSVTQANSVSHAGRLGVACLAAATPTSLAVAKVAYIVAYRI